MPTVGSIIAKNIPLKWIPVTASVMDAVRIMVGHNVGALPVLDGDQLVGIFSERDLMKRVIVKGSDPTKVPVAEVMTRELVTADINDDHAECLKKMTDNRFRHLPVLEDGRLMGILSVRDLMRTEVEGKEREIKSLTDYIHYVPPAP